MGGLSEVKIWQWARRFSLAVGPHEEIHSGSEETNIMYYS